jgi:hypothetical protein
MFELTSSISTNTLALAQAELQQLIRQEAIAGRLNREKAVPMPAITGGTGDPDQQRFLSDTLKNHVLVQFGAGAATCGTIAIIQKHEEYRPERGKIYEEASPVLIDSAAESSWGQQYMRSAPKDPEATFLTRCQISVFFREFYSGEPGPGNPHYKWQRYFKYVKRDGYLTLPYEVYTRNCYEEDGITLATNPDFPNKWAGRA